MPDQRRAIAPERLFALPRPELAPYLKNIVGGGFPVSTPHLPASPDAQLVVYLDGGATVLGGEAAGRLPQAFVTGPTLEPRRFLVQPGSAFMAAVFRPSGILHCLGMPADFLGARPVPLDALAGQAQALRLQDELHHARGFHERVRMLEDFLLNQRGATARLPPALPRLSFERLFLPVESLATELGLGARQFERRFLAHHGVTLRDYRRLARFALALSLLMRGQGRPSLALAAHEAGYVDQAHFSRDFRLFVGDTPSRFLARREEEASGYGFWQFGRAELDSFTR